MRPLSWVFAINTRLGVGGALFFIYYFIYLSTHLSSFPFILLCCFLYASYTSGTCQQPSLLFWYQLIQTTEREGNTEYSVLAVFLYWRVLKNSSLKHWNAAGTLNPKHLVTGSLKVASNVREKSLHRNISREKECERGRRKVDYCTRRTLHRNYCKALSSLSLQASKLSGWSALLHFCQSFF